MLSSASGMDSSPPDEGLTPVERRAVEASTFGVIYRPEEKVRTLVVESFPSLGRLAALRFLEWTQANPGGVVSLPTGKTPEYFIYWVTRLLENWDTRETAADLEAAGIDPSCKPNLGSLRFVQIDEFYPIPSPRENSFCSYVERFYLGGFGLDPAAAMLIRCEEIGLPRGRTLEAVWPDGNVDLGLRYRAAKDGLEQIQKDVIGAIDQWCQDYEQAIRGLGGIGFFLGGIGPDGHIGFNVRGSDHLSVTRLTEVNYETQAAAAVELGGIELALKRPVITIGLGSITHNSDCCAIIIAAGEAKAGVVAAAVQEEPHIRYPATSLQALPRARFYITSGAAKELSRRQLFLMASAEALDDAEVERAVVDLALKQRRRVLDLGPADFAQDAAGRIVLDRRPEGVEALKSLVCQRLREKIDRGTHTLSSTRFLHTEPHHDDLMLGYLPFIVRHVRDPTNTHYFACMTSGFTSVTDRFLQDHLERLRRHVDTPKFARLMGEGYFDPDDFNGRSRDVWQYLDGVAADDGGARDEGMARRFLRNLLYLYPDSQLSVIEEHLQRLEAYFQEHYPGQRDSEEVQLLKGMCREWEAECLWGYYGWDCTNVIHLRLGFYTGDIFTEEPTVERDVAPILQLLREAAPDVISVALDPEASGPDTHYKVLQATTEAVKRYEGESGRRGIKVWGYRNVWYRFHPSEADIFVPVSLNTFATLQSAFANTFISQRDASFPSYEHFGPFSELAQQIQVEQYDKMKVCLGRDWFYQHPSPLIRATRGLVYLKEMSLPELYHHSRRLRKVAEHT